MFYMVSPGISNQVGLKSTAPVKKSGMPRDNLYGMQFMQSEFFLNIQPDLWIALVLSQESLGHGNEWELVVLKHFNWTLWRLRLLKRVSTGEIYEYPAGSQN